MRHLLIASLLLAAASDPADTAGKSAGGGSTPPPPSDELKAAKARNENLERQIASLRQDNEELKKRNDELLRGNQSLLADVDRLGKAKSVLTPPEAVEPTYAQKAAHHQELLAKGLVKEAAEFHKKHIITHDD